MLGCHVWQFSWKVQAHSPIPEESNGKENSALTIRDQKPAIGGSRNGAEHDRNSDVTQGLVIGYIGFIQVQRLCAVSVNRRDI